ncbi:hypothetical protein ESZ91_04950 [Candidatus Borkfalkia ceftriaxoniphila]|uniref:DUF5010 domain-containing protein n=1 Tax=Candidatus Borkfalkia ceftriaxoniphila TaxID=2508949 RepID=A0A4Q2KEY0_9FIRM|nr:hypothetical protein [Candidatus Borkfalkia ceftriaxoniphila]RXZ61741.1 hypothetical protein ESZ91_04950 [Candidatus Borkfalkia ceftriaxoniphila]
MKKIVALILGLTFLFAFAACGGGGKQSGTLTGTLRDSDDYSTGFMRTSATDDYDRSFGEVTDYNGNVVGIFYFLWLSQASVTTNVDSYIEDGNVEAVLTGDEVGMAPAFTYWGEPMYGFYQVEDEWVVRKHVELFINAGLDFICFDCTNNDFYQAAAKAVLDVLLEYAEMGYDVPRAMFMTNSDSTLMTENIYNAFYRRDTYDAVWFYGNGDKPWIISSYAGSNANILDRFYFKPAQWPNRSYNENGFPWISWHYPQETYTDRENDYTIMSVSVSQHTGIGGSLSDAGVSGINFSISGLFAPYNYDTLSDSLKARVSSETATKYYNYNWGRGYSHETGSNDYDSALANVNFEEQWDSALQNEDVNLVFVTGWNEWIAQKQSKDPLLGSSYGYFVDTFSTEFSRDIEMMNGGYLDNCYLQLVANIREYKGVGYGTQVTRNATVAKGTDLFDLSNWSAAPVYKDLVGETEPRAALGAGGNYYTNDTGRNDIQEVRVASDEEYVYFLVAAAEDITAKEAADTRWMNVFIGIEGAEGGWNGLQYVVNRSLDGTTASLDKIENGAYASVGTAATVVSGRYMLVQVAKRSLGIEGDEFGIVFKVTDNLQKDFDVTDLYTNGDAAPIGRINYSYYNG